MSITIQDNNIASTDTLTLNNQQLSKLAFTGNWDDITNRPSSIDSQIVEQGSNGVCRWRVWSDGLIEQWSIQNNRIATTTMNKTFTFAKPYSNDQYTLLGVGFVISNCGAQYGSKTSTGFTTTSEAENSGTSGWYAIGY